MKMAFRPLLFLMLVSVLSLSSISAGGDVGTEHAANPDPAQSGKISRPKDAKEDTASIKEQQDKEYWCKRAAYYKKRIEKAQYEVDKEDELLSELTDAGSLETGADKKYIDKKIAKTQDKLVSAQKLLKDRQRDLARLEDEARTKKIPAEWLQCRPVW
ncbi:MAG: hypothetical protein HQL08_07280 [Nitrospirae bacterium]|nr:hypothetical protein [Nitrospirota bacterium]